MTGPGDATEYTTAQAAEHTAEHTTEATSEHTPDRTPAHRDETTVDIVIACLRGAVVSSVLGVFAMLAPGGAARRIVFAVALAAGAAAAVHYLARRGHVVRRPGGRSARQRDAA
ncbi:hypothetical protein [Streptodolium elevatio]